MDQFFVGQRVVKECSRGVRGLDDYMHFKAQEFRNYLLFLWPAIIDAITPGTQFSEAIKEYWHLFIFLSRAYTCLNDAELKKISKKTLEWAMNRFLTLFTRINGKKNCSYNLHMFSHIDTTRLFGNLNELSTELFEASYAFLMAAYHAGTYSTPKQAMKHLFGRKVKEFPRFHCCRSEARLCTYEETKKSSKNDDSLIFANGEFFRIINFVDEERKVMECQSLVTNMYWDQVCHANDIEWSSVQVQKTKGLLRENFSVIQKKDITAKAIICGEVISSVPLSVLFEGKD